MTAELFGRIATQIEKDGPDVPKFNMDHYIEGDPGDPPCETAGCIAGHAVFMLDRATWDAVLEIADPIKRNQVINDRARELLGLGFLQTDALFRLGYSGYSTLSAKEPDALAMLRWLAASGPRLPSHVEIGDKWNQLIWTRSRAEIAA
jgi:hypothetical protein